MPVPGQVLRSIPDTSDRFRRAITSAQVIFSKLIQRSMPLNFIKSSGAFISALRLQIADVGKPLDLQGNISQATEVGGS
jgi:hypothetical protein